MVPAAVTRLKPVAADSFACRGEYRDMSLKNQYEKEIIICLYREQQPKPDEPGICTYAWR